LSEELVEGLDERSWADLGLRGYFVARVDVSELEFDRSKRESMNADVFARLGLA
jgi:hypothetical protein